MKKRVLAIAVLAAAAAAWWLWPSASVQETIRLTGNIEMTEVQVAFEIPGRIAELSLEEGDRVAQGSLVARLDPEEPNQRRNQTLAELQAARARVGELQALKAFQEENLAGRTASRQAQLQALRAQLQELLAGNRRQEIDEAEAALRLARSQLVNAQADFQRAKELIEHEDISKERFDLLQTAFQTSQATVDRADQRLDLLREGARREDIDEARARVRQAEAELRLAQAGRLDIRRTVRSIAAAQADIERIQALIKQIDSQLEETRAMASIEGTVLLKTAELGEVVAPGTPVLTLADTRRPWMRAYIPGDYLGRVKLGAPVKIFTDSYPDKVYPGEITFISSEAEFTPRQVLTPEQRSRLVYRIKITLDNASGELKLNMPCDAEIRLQPASSSQEEG